MANTRSVKTVTGVKIKVESDTQDLSKKVASIEGFLNPVSSKMDALEKKMDDLATEVNTFDILLDTFNDSLKSIEKRLEKLETK